tara:strand:+ start:27 stop:797 length:771 start_codon:yes stop_codon:yes gene_type:complete
MEEIIHSWSNHILNGLVENSPQEQKYLSDLIDNSIVEKNKAKENRKYIGGSSLGDKCSRKIQYRFMETKVDSDKEFNAKTLRIFELGHVLEEMKANWIRNAGFDLKTEDKNGNQFGFSVADNKIKGHIDGVICGGPNQFKYPMLWECKSANDKNYKDIVKFGVAKSKPEYASQIAIYQAYMELHENPALFSVINKNTCEIYYEFVPFNKILAQETSDKAVEIIKSTDASEMLPRIALDRNYFICKFCEFNKTCWEK